MGLLFILHYLFAFSITLFNPWPMDLDCRWFPLEDTSFNYTNATVHFTVRSCVGRCHPILREMGFIVDMYHSVVSNETLCNIISASFNDTLMQLSCRRVEYFI